MKKDALKHLKNVYPINKPWNILEWGFIIYVLFGMMYCLCSCSHVNKHKSETSSNVDSTNVKHENNVIINSHVEDSSNAIKKSIKKQIDSISSQTVTVLFDKDTSGKQTEISIKVDSTGNVNIKTNKPVKSVNTTQKQANKKQEKQTNSNASHTKKADTNIKASDKDDSTSKKADINITSKDVDKGGFSWSFLWWLIPLLVIVAAWHFKNPLIDWWKNKWG